MEVLVAAVVGVTMACSVYLLLSPNHIRAVFGLILLSNVINLFILTAGDLTWREPPLLTGEEAVNAEEVTNPLPQALILTAIVISFGLVTFLLSLANRMRAEFGDVEIEQIEAAEPRVSRRRPVAETADIEPTR